MKQTSWIDIGARVLIAALAAACIVIGCGGGVGEGGTGNGYSQGTITGFGSIFVNDIRFDDSAATVQDADGGSRSSGDLRLGMTAEVDSGAIDSSAGTASATRIRFGSELLGPVTSVDSVNGLVTLLGQTVQVGTTTVFDSSLAGIGAIAVNQQIEVYGSFDPGTGRYRATRIEPKSAGTPFKLRGIVSGLDTGNKRFNIGGASFDYGAAAGVPATLANGSYVRLTLASGPATTTRWTVTSMSAGVRTLSDEDDAKVRGFITAFTSTQTFSVNGQAVNAAGASFPDGTAIGLGVRVEVEGSVKAGVLQATKVSIRTDSQESGHLFQLVGSIGALDEAAKTFVLRGVLVSYARSDLRVDNCKAPATFATCAASFPAEVRGLLSADGTKLDATRITFDD